MSDLVGSLEEEMLGSWEARRRMIGTVFLENSISKKINYEYPQCCTLDISE